MSASLSMGLMVGRPDAPAWRGALLGVGLMAVVALRSLPQILARPPECLNAWRDEVCVQTQRQSRKLGCQPRGGSVAFRTIVLPLVPGKFDVECLCHINCQNRQLLSKFPLFTVIAKS